MDEDLNVDALLAGWELQDNIAELAMELLITGINLGARANSMHLLERYIEKNYELLETEDFQKAVVDSVEHATNELEKRMNDVRGD